MVDDLNSPLDMSVVRTELTDAFSRFNLRDVPQAPEVPDRETWGTGPEAEKDQASMIAIATGAV